MQLPESVRIAAEQYAESLDRKALAKAATAISEKYREEKSSGAELMSGEAEAAAYAVVRMPATFAAVSTALSHAIKHCGKSISTAADIGSGTGASALAVSEILTDELETLHCFERTPSVRKLGEMLLKESDYAYDALWYDADITKAKLPQSYDLITASYLFNELTEADRERVVKMLWEKTNVMLLITEPGTVKGYENIMQLRQILLGCGAAIAYPCPNIEKCPLPEGDWCHFTARAARSKLHKQLKGGDVPYEDEKFSVIAAVRENASPCERRILRHPQISSGFIELHVCTDNGIEDMKVTKSSKLFKNARKADCGDEI